MADDPAISDSESSPLLPRDSQSSSRLKDANNERAIENDVLPEASPLGRNIGWKGAYILVISRVIGSGIFAMPGAILQDIGSPGLACVLWVAGSLVAWAGLVIDIEYGCMLPRSGAAKVYLEYTYRWPRFLASTMFAVQAVLLGFTASNCIVFAKYILFAANTKATDVNTKSIAIGLLTAITVVHSCFYRTGIRIQNALGWLKIGLISFTILTGFFVLIFKRPSSATGETWDDLWKDSNWGLNSLTTAFFKVLYSYAGLSNVNNVLNEVKDPVRTLKFVGPVALLTACLMYILINGAYLSVVPLEEIRQSRELIAALFYSRLGFGRAFLPIAIALSAAGNVMVVTFSLARVNQEVARQGLLPFSPFLASNRPFDAPMGGLIVHYVPSVLVIALPPSNSVYAFIADVELYAGQFFALAIAAGLISLRQKPELHRPFKAWLPAIWLRLLLCIVLIMAPLFPPKKGTSDVDFFYAAYAVVAVSLLLFGLLYWFVWTIVLPQFYGYRLEEEADVLPDGVAITRYVKRKLQ